MQAERQRRWYVNLTEEQREARRASQRVANLTPEQRSRKRAWDYESNSQRMFVCGMYLGRGGFTRQEREDMLAVPPTLRGESLRSPTDPLAS
jgi:hypothetical protein